MQRKRKGLLALWMACVLLLTAQPVMAGTETGAEIEVKLYNGTEVVKPGSSVTWDNEKLSSDTALNASQAKLTAIYGTDLQNNCPDGYTRDGWRMWKDSSGVVASRWVSDTDSDWASYMTDYYDYNLNTILAPNWVPEYSAGSMNADSPAAVIKKTGDNSILVNGSMVSGGSVEADGSVQADGTKFHFQWLHEYKVVKTATAANENEITGTAVDGGDYYDESTGKWTKGGGQSDSMGIECVLQPGDVVVVKDIGGSSSDAPYYFNGYLLNNDDFSKTALETYDRENKVFYGVVPTAGKSYTLYMNNAKSFMDLNVFVSVFRADSAVADQTKAVYTGAAGTYRCQISYEKDVDDGNSGTEKKTFMLLSDSVTIPDTYEITKVCGDNGSCSIEVDGKEITGTPITAEPGQTVTVKAVPADGYEEDVVSVKKTGLATSPDVQFTTVEDGKGNKIRTFTMPDYPVTVSVDFKRIEVIDTTSPVISGVKDGQEYYGPVTFKVEDDSLAGVWVDENEVQLNQDGAYTIQPDNRSHTIVAKDTVGNTVTCTITVYETWVRDGITENSDYILRAGTAYKLGAGTWKITDDDTVYAGESTFYVPVAGSYAFRRQ